MRLTERGPGGDVGRMVGQSAADLIVRAREEISACTGRNLFVDLLEVAGVPQERLTWLAGEQFRIIGSDQRSFALLAARFPQPPASEMFLSLAQGELHALRLLSDFAAALGWGEEDLRAYEPQPLAQAYPAYLAWSALFGTCSGVALAMLANLEEWGGYCGRVAEALLARYDLAEEAVGFFRFFAGPRRASPSRRRWSSPPDLPRAKTRRRQCGRPGPCTPTRSRSGTHSPTALADRKCRALTPSFRAG